MWRIQGTVNDMIKIVGALDIELKFTVELLQKVFYIREGKDYKKDAVHLKICEYLSLQVVRRRSNKYYKELDQIWSKRN